MSAERRNSNIKRRFDFTKINLNTTSSSIEKNESFHILYFGNERQKHG